MRRRGRRKGDADRLLPKRTVRVPFPSAAPSTALTVDNLNEHLVRNNPSYPIKRVADLLFLVWRIAQGNAIAKTHFVVTWLKRSESILRSCPVPVDQLAGLGF